MLPGGAVKPGRRNRTKCGKSLRSATIHHSAEAQKLQNDHYNRIVDRRRSDLQDVTLFAARWNEQAWRLAVCLHAGRHGRYAGERQLDAETAACAIAIADWFAEQQLEILSAGRRDARQAKEDKVLEIFADIPGKPLRARDLQRSGAFPNAEEGQRVLDAMVNDGRLIVNSSPAEKGGHPTVTYQVAR